jgi:chromosomal replication initiator protein
LNGVCTIPLSAAEPHASRARPGATGQTRAAASREFIAGAENRLAAVIVERLLSTLPDEASCPTSNSTTWPIYSPLVIHGMPGTGKSHLARGLACEWSRRRPADTVTCLTAAEFAGQFVESIEAKSVDAWRVRLRQPGLFVLEDLGQLVTRPAAQAELAQTLDALADCGAMVIVTSRVSTAELTCLSARLKSRLVAGLDVALELPGPAARTAIVEQWAAARNVTIVNSAARLLGVALSSCAAELGGVLSQLECAAADQRTPTIDEPLVRRFLAERAAPRRASLNGIAISTARYFVLRVADLKSPSRRRTVVMARDVAMYLARQLTGKSLKQIGDYFGGRDHTTVLHGCHKTEDLIQSDPATRQAVAELRQGLAM